MNKKDKKEVKVGTKLKCVKSLWLTHYDKKVGKFKLFTEGKTYTINSISYEGKYHIVGDEHKAYPGAKENHHGWGHHTLDNFELA